MKNFKGKQFEKEVIILAVGYYLRYSLSYREIREILLERGISVCHTTIYRWVLEYSEKLYKNWKKHKQKPSIHWHMDETYIKIKGKWHYLYRAIDEFGDTIDIWLRKKRDKQAAYSFFKRLFEKYGVPRRLITDKAPSIKSALKTLNKEGYQTYNRSVKYKNNIIESDHRFVKKRHRLYKTSNSASKTIKGIEVMHALYKYNKKTLSLYNSVFLPCNSINKLLTIS